jgi:hypothetical protein
MLEDKHIEERAPKYDKFAEHIKKHYAGKQVNYIHARLVSNVYENIHYT